MKQSSNARWAVLNSSILLLVIALGAASCQSHEQAAMKGEPAPQAENKRQDKAVQSLAPAIKGRKIVYTGELSLRVRSYEHTRSEIERLLERSGGYIARGETQGSGDQRYATLTLRLPSSEFAALRNQLKKLGEVDSESIAADDVTEQHVDLTARLANARKLEARLLELVAMQTSSVADLLVVEAELGRVREQIERLDAQLRNMDDQVSMATLTLSIYTEQANVAALALTDRMSEALTSSYRALGDSGAVLMVAVSALLPWALLFALIALGVRRIRWALSKRKVASGPQS